jgi:Domain of unknown function (DUF4349)
MSSPELAAPARLEELLGGAFPETQEEARLQGLARELRSATISAPSELRERVAGIGVSAQPRMRRPGRRLVAALAVAVLVLAGGAFAALRLAAHDGMKVEHGSLAPPTRHAERNVPSASKENLERVGRAQTSSAPPAPTVFEPAPRNRAQDIDMWIDLRVQDADRISSALQDAVRITRSLGGVVTSSTVDTKGTQGRAQLTLRIPVGNLDDAVFRLTQLGTVTAQRTNTQDLQAPLNRLGRMIEHLRSEIRIELARLASGTLDPAEELEARIHLENLRRNLREARANRASIVRRTSMADLTLRLATAAPGAADKSESGVSGAAHKAADFLRGAGAVAVFLALVLSPLLVLAILAWLALRTRSRRIEARLLDEPQPGAPTRSS